MKTLKCLIIVLVLAVISSATVSANPNGEMKASPLYKASLENSIAKLEGKAETQPLYTDANGNVLATSSGCVVPDARETQISTCSPSYCGSSQTCVWTCYDNTCQSTCANTCVSTCSNTCVGNPGACKTYPIAGYAYWRDYWDGQYSSNWNILINYTEYALYQGSAGSVSVAFDDEGLPGPVISGVNAGTGWFSGSRTRTTTNDGVNLTHAVILWHGLNYGAYYGYGHKYGPLSYSSTNYVNTWLYLY